MNEIKVGDLWLNSKRQTVYRIICIAMNADDPEIPSVVYQDIKNPHKIWHRTQESFLGNTIIDNQLTPRFTKVGEGQPKIG